MARPRTLSRERIQAAALALVDAEGLAALTMRALAGALGTGTMTLYHHVAGRRELEALVVDAVLAAAAWPRGPHADWRAEVRAIAGAAWRAVRAHPHAIPLIATRRSGSPVFLDFAEALLAALARSGRSGHALLVAFRAVTALVLGLAQVELTGPLATETAAQAVARFRALPPRRYPRLRQIAKAAASSDAEREFRRALDALLAGLGEGRASRRG